MQLSRNDPLPYTMGPLSVQGHCPQASANLRVAELEPPIDTVWIHIKETEGCTRSAERVRDMGYQGKLCIHPDQVGPVNTVFTPTVDEVAFAEKVVAAFEAAEAEGLASIQVDGYFVDYPIVDQARRTLDLMARIKSRS